MGRLTRTLGKVGDRVFGTKQERSQRVGDKVVEENAYKEAYRKARLTRARREGAAAGRKGKGKDSTLNAVARYGASFSKAGEEMFGLPKQSKRKKKNDWLDF